MSMDSMVLPIAARLRHGQHRVACPNCGPQRKKKGDRSLSVKIDGDAAVYHCWHCEENGVVSIREREAPPRMERMRPMAPAPKKQWSDLTEKGIAYLKSRGISEQTARKCGVRSAHHFTQAAGKQTDCLVFPYLNKGEEYAAKIRSTECKGFACNGAPVTLWNMHGFTTGDWIIICEGEIDALTLVEAGYAGATSIPSGAVSKVSNGAVNPEDDRKFSFIWDAKDKLALAKRIVICCDNDAPGQAMAEEIARRIGKDRVWTVEYPEGCKDANDVWLKHGQDGIDTLISECSPWPISGLYDSQHFFDQLDDMYANGMGRGESTGYASVDELYTISPGMLTIVTGHPSSGKSELVDQLMVNLASSKGWSFAVGSFENEPRLHIAKLISKYMRKPFFDGVSERLSPEELHIGKEFVQSHFSFIYQADGTLAKLDSILERIRAAVMRHGVRGAVIDPYNYIEKSSDVSETEWISVMLSRVRSFAVAHGLHIWFIAHPAKMMRSASGDIPPPKGYDISGSAAWFAKADHGLTVHRPDPVKSLLSEVISWKCRFSWLGKQGSTSLLYSPVTTSYSEIDSDPFAHLHQTKDPFEDIGPNPMDAKRAEEESDDPF